MNVERCVSLSREKFGHVEHLTRRRRRERIAHARLRVGGDRQRDARGLLRIGVGVAARVDEIRAERRHVVEHRRAHGFAVFARDGEIRGLVVDACEIVAEQILHRRRLRQRRPHDLRARLVAGDRGRRSEPPQFAGDERTRRGGRAAGERSSLLEDHRGTIDLIEPRTRLVGRGGSALPRPACGERAGVRGHNERVDVGREVFRVEAFEISARRQMRGAERDVMSGFTARSSTAARFRFNAIAAASPPAGTITSNTRTRPVSFGASARSSFAHSSAEADAALASSASHTGIFFC